MKTKYKLIIIFALAFGIRLYLSYTRFGNYYDVDLPLNWIKQIQEHGLINIYIKTTYFDNNSFIYPPLMAYLFGFLSKLFLLIPENLWFFFFKLPSIFSDLITGWLIYSITKKNKLSIVFTSLYLFQPLVIYLSSVWGQLDSLMVPFIVGSLYFVKKNPYLAVIFITLGFLTKLQALFFLPLILFIIFKEHEIKKAIISAFTCLITLITVSLPFLINGQLNILYEKILKRSVEIHSILSLSAFNFWWGLYGQQAHTINDTLSVIWFINYKLLAFIIVSIIYLLILYKIYRQKNISLYQYFLFASSVSLVCFMFLTQMHERYFFPLIALLTLSFSAFLWLEKIYFTLSLTLFLNLLYWMPLGRLDYYLLNLPLFNTFIALVNLFALFYLLKNVLFNRSALTK